MANIEHNFSDSDIITVLLYRPAHVLEDFNFLILVDGEEDPMDSELYIPDTINQESCCSITFTLAEKKSGKILIDFHS